MIEAETTSRDRMFFATTFDWVRGYHHRGNKGHWYSAARVSKRFRIEIVSLDVNGACVGTLRRQDRSFLDSINAALLQIDNAFGHLFEVDGNQRRQLFFCRRLYIPQARQAISREISAVNERPEDMSATRDVIDRLSVWGDR